MEYELAGLWEPSRFKFTGTEIVRLMKQLHSVFDAVRLVSPETGNQWTLDEEDRLHESEYKCWTVWQSSERCANCISRRAVARHGRICKFEFMNDDLHHVTAKYVEVDDVPYSMEMIFAMPDETMMEGHGKHDIVEAITKRNRRIYADPLTGAYNRRYLEEMFQGGYTNRAVAMIDVDMFKQVNDTYGHRVGDQVLKNIVGSVLSCVRSADAVIRFGGDEFIIVFDGMPEQTLLGKLEQIRQRVRTLSFQDRPELRPTISIGGVYGDGSMNELIDRADKMLYRAKEAGRNCIRVEGAG